MTRTCAICFVLVTFQTTTYGSSLRCIYPESHFLDMLSIPRKKIFRFHCATLFSLLICLPVVAAAFPDQYPLEEGSKAELRKILETADQALYPIQATLSPGSLFLHGSTQMLIIMDPKTVQFLPLAKRQDLTAQAGACFLLAADQWEALGIQDSFILAKTAMIALCLEVGAEMPGTPELITEVKEWRSLSRSLQESTRLDHLFPASEEARDSICNIVRESIQKLENPRPLAIPINIGMRSWTKGSWSGTAWLQRKLLYAVATNLLSLGKWEDSAILLETAIAMYEPWNLPFMELELLTLLRNIRLTQGKTELQREAMETFEKIANAYPNTRVWKLFAQLDQVTVLKTNGMFGAANTVLDQVEDVVEAHSEYYEWELLYASIIELQISNIWLDAGDLSQALDHIEQTISVSHKISPQENPLMNYQLTILRSAHQHAKAELFFKMGRIEQGMTTFFLADQTLEAAAKQAADMPLPLVERKAIKAMTGMNPEELFDAPKAIGKANMGILLGESGNPVLGIQLLQEAFDGQRKADDSEASINTFLYLAKFFHETIAPQDSILKYLTLAKQHILQTEKNGYLTDLVLANSAYLEFGPDSTKIFLDSALTIAPKERRREVIIALGEYLLEHHKPKEAIIWLQDSLPDDGKFSDLSQGIQAYSLKGRCLEELGERQQAKLTYQAGWNYFQSSTERQLGTISARFLAMEVWPLVDGISRYFLLTGEADSALFWQEQIRANFLSYLTTRYKDLPPGPEKDLLLEAEQALAFLNMEIAQLGHSPERLQKKAELILRIQSIRLELSPELSVAMSPSQIYSQLKPDELILQYLITGEDLWVIAITEAGSLSIPLGLYRPVDSLVSAWKNLVSTYGQANQIPDNESGKTREEILLNNLHQSLISPIPDSLLAKHSAIFIVPDGLLYETPFAALSPASEHSTYQNFLGYDHTITWLPAASWISQRNSTVTAPYESGQVLILANSGGRVPTEPTPNLLPSRRGLPGPLRFTGYEATAVARVFDEGKTTLLVEEEASEEWLHAASQTEHIKNYDIIHFAGHVSINPTHPSLSATLLEPTLAKGFDGFVDVFDWSNMDLRASLVVLSGCRSSLGEPLRGAGRLGFLHSLSRQGAAQVILSQWNVDDGSTALLFEQFYQHLNQTSGDAATALQLAQINMATSTKVYSSPFYWAAFQVFGVH